MPFARALRAILALGGVLFISGFAPARPHTAFDVVCDAMVCLLGLGYGCATCRKHWAFVRSRRKFRGAREALTKLSCSRAPFVRARDLFFSRVTSN